MKNQVEKREEKIRVKLRERLSLSNIHKEHQIITHLNKHMEISILHLQQIDLLQNLSKEDVIKIVKTIPFLKYIHHSENSRKECVRIEYDNAGRTLIVTGIQREYIEKMLYNFNNSRRYGQFLTKNPNCKIIHSNSFWFAIETSSDEASSVLKKYLRNEKRTLDEKDRMLNYKIDRKRIRIVIVKEDLFTILVDAMTQYKSQLFRNNFFQGQITQKKEPINVIYRPIIYNNYYSARNQKEEQLSDGFSQSNSLNSELFDPNKMKDIIETSDQGIQSQNNIPQIGIQVNEETNENQMHSSPNLSSKSPNKQAVNSEKQDQNKEQKLNDQYHSPHKKRQSSLEGICTEKSSPFYNHHESNIEGNIISSKNRLNHSYSVQTQQPLYSIIPDHLMRRLLQQFKNKNHNKLVQLPDWLKSESQSQRNRHRFFSSLCKPKLVNKNQPL